MAPVAVLVCMVAMLGRSDAPACRSPGHNRRPGEVRRLVLSTSASEPPVAEHLAPEQEDATGDDHRQERLQTLAHSCVLGGAQPRGEHQHRTGVHDRDQQAQRHGVTDSATRTGKIGPDECLAMARSKRVDRPDTGRDQQPQECGCPAELRVVDQPDQ
jgi:hypothetical protein